MVDFCLYNIILTLSAALPCLCLMFHSYVTRGSLVTSLVSLLRLNVTRSTGWPIELCQNLVLGNIPVVVCSTSLPGEVHVLLWSIPVTICLISSFDSRCNYFFRWGMIGVKDCNSIPYLEKHDNDKPYIYKHLWWGVSSKKVSIWQIVIYLYVMTSLIFTIIYEWCEYSVIWECIHLIVPCV